MIICMHDHPAILRAILDVYALPASGEHGIAHWARVLENGLKIAASNGADTEVVALFALFHDSRRVNEDEDDGHGARGAQFARSLRGRLVHLDGRTTAPSPGTNRPTFYQRGDGAPTQTRPQTREHQRGTDYRVSLNSHKTVTFK